MAGTAFAAVHPPLQVVDNGTGFCKAGFAGKHLATCYPLLACRCAGYGICDISNLPVHHSPSPVLPACPYLQAMRSLNRSHAWWAAHCKATAAAACQKALSPRCAVSDVAQQCRNAAAAAGSGPLLTTSWHSHGAMRPSRPPAQPEQPTATPLHRLLLYWQNVYVGTEAAANKQRLDIRYPITCAMTCLCALPPGRLGCAASAPASRSRACPYCMRGSFSHHLSDAQSTLLHRPTPLSPGSNGVVEDWEDMGLVWDHCFRDVLGVDPSGGGCYIMLTGGRGVMLAPAPAVEACACEAK